MSKRESFLTVSEQVAIAPGPGQYVPDSGQLIKIKGGGALQNKVLLLSDCSYVLRTICLCNVMETLTITN